MVTSNPRVFKDHGEPRHRGLGRMHQLYRADRLLGELLSGAHRSVDECAAAAGTSRAYAYVLAAAFESAGVPLVRGRGKLGCTLRLKLRAGCEEAKVPSEILDAFRTITPNTSRFRAASVLVAIRKMRPHTSGWVTVEEFMGVSELPRASCYHYVNAMAGLGIVEFDSPCGRPHDPRMMRSRAILVRSA